MRWRGLFLCSCFTVTSSLLTSRQGHFTDCIIHLCSSNYCGTSSWSHVTSIRVDATDDDVDDGDDDEYNDTHDQLIVLDRRPHAQRAKGPRIARRLNHPFKYLYRHDAVSSHNISLVVDEAMTSRQYLHHYGGFTEDEVDEMSRNFPPLLDMDVQRHLRPKLQFLQKTILNHTTAQSTLPEDIRRRIPPQYFGARLERTLAPRHAFLVYMNLPSGPQLFSETNQPFNNNNNKNPSTIMWHDFLLSCRHPKRFAALCNRWRQQQQQQHHLQRNNHGSMNHDNNNILITSKQIEAFDALFSRGLMAAARNELCQPNNEWPLKYVNMTSSQLISLLIQHGANPLERDIRGVSLLHWAAGTGNLAAVQVLLPYFAPKGIFTEAERDGALPLHWAAAGAKTREFGCGGHPDVCQFILEQQELQQHSVETSVETSKQLVNAVTKDGNSALMWAAWSGTLETVKLLIRNRADPTIGNRNGCTVAHWAASGGNVAVCQYLADICRVDFAIPNPGGNTPLTHAIAFGRVDVVSWLRRKGIGDLGDSDKAAMHLAQDFVTWTDGEGKRQQILDLMADWFGIPDEDSNGMNKYQDDLDASKVEMY